jgi:hypothetical protein
MKSIATGLDGRVTARSFLFGPDGLAELGQRLEDADVLSAAADGLGAAGESLWRVGGQQLAGVASDFLELDLASVALSGWRKHRELLAAADRTRGTTQRAVVPLGNRDISLVQTPSIDVMVGEATLTVVRFELRVDIAVLGVAGVVRDGALVALTGGGCEVTVSFSAAGVRLAEKTGRIDPHLAIPLGGGLPLRLPGPRHGSG